MAGSSESDRKRTPMSDLETTVPTEPGPFDQKNADRKRNRDLVGHHRYNEARSWRRRYTIGGAFARPPANKLWNDLVVGTNGLPRSEREDRS